MIDLKTFPPQSHALIIGSSGGIGSALTTHLGQAAAFARAHQWSRSGPIGIDITDEASIIAAVGSLEATPDIRDNLRLVVVASGILSRDGLTPEKSWRQIDPEQMARSFAVNTIGPALLIKHLAPVLPRKGRTVFAVISAKVGSIGDNHTGGWYSYRASKAAVNQIVRCGAIEAARRNKDAVMVSLHPGTVATPFTDGFLKSGLDVQPADTAAERLLSTIDGLHPSDSGGFFTQRGEPLPW